LALKSFAWLNSLFFGVALIVAVGIGRVVEINNGRVAVRRRAASRHVDGTDAAPPMLLSSPPPEPGP
jgi:hypothetical protein